MKIKFSFCFFAKVLSKILLVVLIGLKLPAFAQTTLVYLHPPQQDIQIDSIAVVKLQISDVQDLHGYSVLLSYNPSVLRFQNLSELSFFSGYSTFFTFFLDSVNGSIQIDCAVLGAYSRSGSGSLAEIRLKGKSLGNVNLSFVEVDLRNQLNQTITANSLGCSISVSQTTGVSGTYEIPSVFTLHQNYPNPFNPSTTIQFDVPENSTVSVIVYDILGRQVAELVNGEVEAGRYQHTLEGSQMASGIYFLRISATSLISERKLTDLKKMILMK